MACLCRWCDRSDSIEELGLGRDHLRIGVPEDVLELSSAAGGVDGDEDSTQPGAAEQALEDLPAILAQDRDPVAGFHAGLGERAGEASGGDSKALVRVGGSLGYEARSIAETLRLQLDDPSKRAFERGQPEDLGRRAQRITGIHAVILRRRIWHVTC